MGPQDRIIAPLFSASWVTGITAAPTCLSCAPPSKLWEEGGQSPAHPHIPSAWLTGSLRTGLIHEEWVFITNLPTPKRFYVFENLSTPSEAHFKPTTAILVRFCTGITSERSVKMNYTHRINYGTWVLKAACAHHFPLDRKPQKPIASSQTGLRAISVWCMYEAGGMRALSGLLDGGCLSYGRTESLAL